MRVRKYFGTDGIRGRVGSDLINPEFLTKLGWAAGMVLARSSIDKVVIGKDTRLSCYMIEAALQAGFTAAGIDVIMLGPLPTPAIAFLTNSLRAEAGIVISASHNPYHDNGIKFFNHEGIKLNDEIELKIEEFIDKPMTMVDNNIIGRAKRIHDARGRYIEFCKTRIERGVVLDGLKVVLDCANGAAYKVAPLVFKELGATVVEFGVSPSGRNINHNCGSTHPEILSKLVIAEEADLGIALDGDADRLIVIDEQGQEIDGDQILFLLSEYYQAVGIPVPGIVGTIMTNMGLEKALAEKGIDFVRTSVGDRYVAREMRERDWYLGGESSGHIICRDATTTGDGIIASLKVLSAMKYFNVPLSSLATKMQKYPMKMVNVECKNPKEVLERTPVLDMIERIESELGSEGRMVIRPSGTEPVIRVMIEAKRVELIEPLIERMQSVL